MILETNSEQNRGKSLKSNMDELKRIIKQQEELIKLKDIRIKKLEEKLDIKQDIINELKK